MKYMGMPAGMWALYKSSFQKQLTAVLGLREEDAARITAAAKPKYRAIIEKLPEFEKADRFKLNIVSCAMFAAFLLAMEPRPSAERLTAYYERAMMTAPTKWFCRIEGKRKFTPKDIRGMQATAALRAADRNPYSWNTEFLPYPDGSGYKARFSKCGICTLMKELGLFEYVPAMCHLDDPMTEAGGAADFVREYTLAGGGPYCDCGYRKRRTGMNREDSNR